jgi:hypothetical protein
MFIVVALITNVVLIPKLICYSKATFGFQACIIDLKLEPTLGKV